MRKIRLTRVSVSFYFRPHGSWAGCKGRATAICININSPAPHWQIVNDVLCALANNCVCLALAQCLTGADRRRSRSTDKTTVQLARGASVVANYITAYNAATYRLLFAGYFQSLREELV